MAAGSRTPAAPPQPQARAKQGSDLHMHTLTPPTHLGSLAALRAVRGKGNRVGCEPLEANTGEDNGDAQPACVLAP